LKIPFPLKGLDENWAVSGQPPLTSPDLQNVRPRDVQDKRSRGGQRPAVRKIMYWWDYPGEGGDLGLPVPSPIIGLTQVTAVYYASVAGEYGVSYSDPTGGDPKWDGVVLWSGLDNGHEVQAYSFTGNSLFERVLSSGTGNGYNGLSLDGVGNIYAYSSDGKLRKWDREGNLLAARTVGPLIGKIWPSIKNDDVVFWAGNDTIYALNGTSSTFDSLYNRDFNKTIYDIAQLSDSDDIIVPLLASAGVQAKRVKRTDLTDVTNYNFGAAGARSLAVDETNGWIYIVSGTTVYRADLSDGDNVESHVIAGGNLLFVRLYGGSVYVCGDRATDNNTVWKIDAGLTAVEADYDTGDTVNQIRILDNGTVYAVGVHGTNEDAADGNVNVLNSDLVRSDTWNVRSGKEMDSIAEKWGIH